MEKNDFTRLITHWMEEHKQQLFRYICYRTGSASDAEDILQDIYLRLLERKCRNLTIDNPGAYIFQSVVNECSRRLRNPAPLTVDITEMPDLENEPDSFEEEFKRINILLGSMPSEMRETVRLHIYASMTFDEIADILSVSSTTAKRRYYAALDFLRNKYPKL